MIRPSRECEQQRLRRCPDIVCHPNIRIIDLSLSCLVTELQDDFTYLFNTGRTDRVPAGFKSPARVNRDLSAQGSFTISGKFSCLPFPAESEVFNRTNLGNRETIVYFHHIDIFMSKFCQPECFLSCSYCCIQGRNIPPVMERNGITGLSTRKVL